MQKRTWVKLGVAASVVAAAAAALALWPADNGADTATVSQKDDGLACSIIGDSNTVTCSAGGNDSRSIDDDIEDDARKHKDTPPTGDGPWQFAVVRTDGIGLKVRSTNKLDALQLGGLGEHHIAWADCQAQSDFDPDPGTGSGPTWLRIRWGQQTPSTAYFESSPSEETTAWAFAGYLEPVGHSGDIPGC